MRKELGILHFFVNGVDQGPAAFNVPEHVFGIIGKIYWRWLVLLIDCAYIINLMFLVQICMGVPLKRQ